MEPTYSFTELKSMFYEWFYVTFPEKFSQLTPTEKEAVCEVNFRAMIEWQHNGISAMQFPSLKSNKN